MRQRESAAVVLVTTDCPHGSEEVVMLKADFLGLIRPSEQRVEACLNVRWLDVWSEIRPLDTTTGPLTITDNDKRRTCELALADQGYAVMVQAAVGVARGKDRTVSGVAW